MSDGSSLAFIETSTTAGVQYFARTAELSGGPGRASALTAADVVSLGVAWKPGANEPTFGREPGAVATDNSRAQSAAGFDVPLAYSADGSSLAVQRWSGESFSQPGEGALQLLVPGGDRLAMEGVARFFGWATR